MSATKAEMKLLIQAIEFFLDRPKATRWHSPTPFYFAVVSTNGEGIDSANLFHMGQGQPDRMVVFQEFREGASTIADREPEWKADLLAAAVDS